MIRQCKMNIQNCSKIIKKFKIFVYTVMLGAYKLDSRLPFDVVSELTFSFG